MITVSEPSSVCSLEKSRLRVLLCSCLSVVIALLGSAFGEEPQPPPGYKYCARNDEYKTFKQKTHLAFGGHGSFYYLYNQVGTICFDNATFGNFPMGKGGYDGFCKVATDANQSTAPLCEALKKIKDHLTGTTPLAGPQINNLTQIIERDIFLIGNDRAVITQAFDVVSYYETNYGPIFINDSTKEKFPYAPGASDGFELVRAVFAIQQGIHDHVYTAENLAKYGPLLKGRKFETAAYFPGAVDAPSNPTASSVVKINASLPTFWGKPTCFSSKATLRPTGYYLAPGSIGTVTVPSSLEDKGFSVVVGAHARNKVGSNPVHRFYRVSKTYPITSTTTTIANPFGGGIYILVPYQASAGLVDVRITNAVASPFFSATSFHKTTLQEWIEIQRKNPGPWADFESDKFMMQVPRSWIYNFADPVATMTEWDKCMDAFSELLGYPLVRNNPVLYTQVDLDIMTFGFGVGYPQINTTYRPNDPTDGNKNHWLLHPGTSHEHTNFHELGHEHLFSKFPGEEEAAVNLLPMAIWCRKFGWDIDSAFAFSMGDTPGITRDQAALNWMVTPNFRDGKPMDITDSTLNEVRYQHRGYAKYVDIAALFGWDVLDHFYHQEHLDYMAKKPSDGLNEVDSRILRLSKAAGVDLRPLIHFWGVQPVDDTKLRSMLASAGLKPSRKIYDRLVHYKSLIPMTNAEFKTHAYTFIGKEITKGVSPDYGEGWYYVWLPLYDETHGAAAQAAMEKIIARYFPNGRPSDS